MTGLPRERSKTFSTPIWALRASPSSKTRRIQPPSAMYCRIFCDTAIPKPPGFKSGGECSNGRTGVSKETDEGRESVESSSGLPRVLNHAHSHGPAEVVHEAVADGFEVRSFRQQCRH